jgi:hypothetical protein
MELNFTCTYQDFLEGMKAIRRPFGPPRRRNWEPLIVIVTAFAAACALIIIAAISQPRAPLGSPVSETFLTRFVASFAVWLILEGFIWALMITVNHPDMRPAIRLYLLLLLLTTAGSTVLSVAFTPPDPPAPRAAEKPSAPLVSFLPLLVNLAGIGGAWVLMMRSIHRKSWDGQHHLHLPHSMRFHEDKLEIANPLIHYDYQWPAFVVFRETANLFVLQPTRMTYWMIPKRACRDAFEVEAVRRFLERKVLNATPQTSGFAVIVPAPSTPPPLPAESPEATG